MSETMIVALKREIWSHNNVAQRMLVVEEQIAVIDHLLSDLEGCRKHPG